MSQKVTLVQFCNHMWLLTANSCCLEAARASNNLSVQLHDTCHELWPTFITEAAIFGRLIGRIPDRFCFFFLIIKSECYEFSKRCIVMLCHSVTAVIWVDIRGGSWGTGWCIWEQKMASTPPESLQFSNNDSCLRWIKVQLAAVNS